MDDGAGTDRGVPGQIDMAEQPAALADRHMWTHGAIGPDRDVGAVIGPDVTIGPYCTVGPHVTIGEGCRLLGHVNLTGHTTIGPRTVIHPFASLGSPPQSFSYRGGPTTLTIGADCDIREGVTANTGTEDGGGATSVGDKCFLMVGSHVGHDCHVGNHVVFANNTVLGGHVTVGDNVVFGGNVAVRQFAVSYTHLRAHE